MSRADDLYGKNSLDALGTGPSPLVPFPAVGGRKDVHDYDQSKVDEAVRSGQKTEPIDPRLLHSRQSGLDRGVLSHYMDQPQGAAPYRDSNQAGNQTPVVYHRDGRPIILSGNHRATVSLLRGEQFHAIQVHGSWGEPRKPTG